MFDYNCRYERNLIHNTKDVFLALCHVVQLRLKKIYIIFLAQENYVYPCVLLLLLKYSGKPSNYAPPPPPTRWAARQQWERNSQRRSQLENWEGFIFINLSFIKICLSKQNLKQFYRVSVNQWCFRLNFARKIHVMKKMKIFDKYLVGKNNNFFHIFHKYVHRQKFLLFFFW